MFYVGGTTVFQWVLNIYFFHVEHIAVSSTVQEIEFVRGRVLFHQAI